MCIRDRVWAAYASVRPRQDGAAPEPPTWRANLLFAGLFVLALFSQEETLLFYPPLLLGFVWWRGWRHLSHLPVLVSQLFILAALGARYLLETVGQPGYFEAASAVRLIEVPARLDRADGDVHPGGNPHLQTDPRNCGACGTVCEAGAECTGIFGGVNTCQACGGAGQRCCQRTTPACGASLLCGRDSFCQACGAPGQPCCGTTCAAGSTCNGSTCTACGGPGQTCCAGSTCSSGLACRSNTCQVSTCGDSGQACCGGSTCNSATLTCSGGSCVACGTSGQRCCTGSTCNVGLACASGTCSSCGGSGELCCASSTCNVGLSCSSTNRCGTSVRCGSRLQPCCAGNTCNLGLRCSGSICF